jgi:hypothetical protein
VKEIDEEIEKLEHKIKHHEKEIPKNPNMFTGIAFVSFDTEDMKDLVILHNQHTFWERFYAWRHNG